MLSGRERSRYTRQLMIHGWGEEGQERVKKSTVFIAGAGGLGSPVSMYLAAAGVGHILLCDCDSLELSNLNRQILHSDQRIGLNKALSGKMTLNQLNPEIEVTAISDRIDADNVARLTEGAQVILDCVDSFPTRFVLNEHAARVGIPMVHGSIYGLEGRVTFIHSPDTPCLACLYGDSPPQEVCPVVGPIPGIVGTIQAMEALKYLTGLGSNLAGRLLTFDGDEMGFREYKTTRAQDCSICGHEN
jgi:molybdopterin/thiamine biosynthesis adenylyltransferase